MKDNFIYLGVPFQVGLSVLSFLYFIKKWNTKKDATSIPNAGIVHKKTEA
jgi:hypothetical protein